MLTGMIYDFFSHYLPFITWKSCALEPTSGSTETIHFDKKVRIKAITGSISSFKELHVLYLLRLDKKTGYEAFWIIEPQNNVVAVFNSGGSGVGELNVSGLDIITDKLYLYVWAHNMWIWKRDFHGTITVYYEDV